MGDVVELFPEANMKHELNIVFRQMHRDGEIEARELGYLFILNDVMDWPEGHRRGDEVTFKYLRTQFQLTNRPTIDLLNSWDGKVIDLERIDGPHNHASFRISFDPAWKKYRNNLKKGSKQSKKRFEASNSNNSNNSKSTTSVSADRAYQSSRNSIEGTKPEDWDAYT